MPQGHGICGGSADTGTTESDWRQCEYLAPCACTQNLDTSFGHEPLQLRYRFLCAAVRAFRPRVLLSVAIPIPVKVFVNFRKSFILRAPASTRLEWRQLATNRHEVVYGSAVFLWSQPSSHGQLLSRAVLSCHLAVSTNHG